MQFTESFLIEGDQNRAFDLLEKYVEAMKFKVKNLVRPNLFVLERGSRLGSVASTQIEDVKTTLMITLRQISKNIEVICNYDVSVYGITLESDRKTLKTEVERLHSFLLTALNPSEVSQNLPPPPPPAPVKKQKNSNGLIAVALVAVVVMVVVVAFVALPLLGVTAPKPEITMTQGREGLSGLNYVYYVDATVVNHGADGQVTVYAEISGAGRNEQQSASVYLSKGESKTVTFTFDISILGSLSNPSINYHAWADTNQIPITK